MCSRSFPLSLWERVGVRVFRAPIPGLRKGLLWERAGVRVFAARKSKWPTTEKPLNNPWCPSAVAPSFSFTSPSFPRTSPSHPRPFPSFPRRRESGPAQPGTRFGARRSTPARIIRRGEGAERLFPPRPLGEGRGEGPRCSPRKVPQEPGASLKTFVTAVPATACSDLDMGRRTVVPPAVQNQPGGAAVTAAPPQVYPAGVWAPGVCQTTRSAVQARLPVAELSPALIGTVGLKPTTCR